VSWLSSIKSVAKGVKAISKAKKADLTVLASVKTPPRANIGKVQTKTTLSDVAPKSKPQVKNQEKGTASGNPPKRLEPIKYQPSGGIAPKAGAVYKDGPQQLKAKVERTKNSLAAEQLARRKAGSGSAARTKTQIKTDEAKKKK